MKKPFFLIAVIVAFCFIATMAFKPVHVGSTIKGWVTPKEAGISAWAISRTDTFKTHVTSEGMFDIMDVKPGTYSIVIQAAQPYKPAQKEGVVVTEGSMVDVGEIKLSK